jgi:hypothetical protein
MRNKVYIGLIGVMLIIGFVFTGCDIDINGGDDKGTAPAITGAIVASSTANAAAWTSVSSFAKATDILVGVKVNDPEKDIVTVGYSVKKSGSSTFLTGEIPCTLPAYPFTGAALAIQLSKLTADQQNASVGTDYTVDIYFIDAEGNKSNTATTNTFAITN